MKKLEFTGNNLHQGDTQWFELKNLPTELKKVEKQYIAASERSGSFHALCGKYDMYETEGGFIVDAKEDCVINHSLEEVLKETGVGFMDDAKVLPKKDHRHSVLKKGIYFTGIQNRFDPLAGQKKRVQD